MKKRYRNRSRLKKDNKIKYIIIAIITAIIIGVIFIKIGISNKEKVTPIYNYTIQKSNDYEVVLKPNDFYTTQNLPAGGYYASNSVDTFAMNLKYKFKSDKKSNIECTYNITANLIGTVKNINEQDKEVWNRSFILLEDITNKQENIDNFSIYEPINIDYEYYNKLARSYEKNYGITIDSNLKIRLNISYNIENSTLTKNEKVEDYIELEIPITSTVTEVKENYEKEESKEVFSQTKQSNIIYYVIPILTIIGIISVIVIIERNKSKKTPQEIYMYNLNRILKYYSDLIVTVSNEPNLKNLNIMKVTILDDLIDVAEQNQCNIIHYEVEKGEKNKFYVIVNNYAYIYSYCV